MPTAELQDRLGEVLGGRYQALCRIGGGGMAQVYLVRHRVHGGLFAVKVLSEHLAQDPSIVSRFTQEARTAASLASHPNVVPIFDIGEGDGLYYIVMQYVAGEDLASYMRREGRLTPPAAANVIAQAAEALSFAESRRIVHRDLKPANMLLDETGRVKLLDFGISKIADVADGLTRPGESLGTPFYMSPEQIRGEGCDVRSDLYSLGVVFFELLSGRRPFESESASAVQIAHLTSPAPSLSAVDPTLPDLCDTIIQKLLAKRREDRYQCTAALLQDLLAHGADTGPGALRPQVDSHLCEALERAASTPLDAQTPAPRGLTQVRSPEQPPSGTSGSDELQPAIEPASFTGSAAPAARPRFPMVWVAVAVLVVLVGAGLAAFLLRSPRGGVPAVTRAVSTPPLPAQIADAHGRMLLVAAGDFVFGAAEQQKTVSLPAFYVDETEVSNAEYQQFCKETGHAAPADPDYAIHADLPVTGVSYEDAAAYATWAGKRLPTEQEWEKAARGVNGRTYPWGNAQWTADIPHQLEPVRSEASRRSPYGAYNMAGNAWEWTASAYTPTAVDLAGMKNLLRGHAFAPTWQIIKGGSFSPGSEEYFAAAKHRGLPTDARSPWIGFRCVRDAAARPRGM